jgi:glycosyltransferase involved in cell wall biosynthesis
MVDTLDIIVLCYNEEEMIPLFYDESEKALRPLNIPYRYIFVDDGSTDNTLKIIKKLANSCGYVNYVSFSRNFGKEAGIYAGLKSSSGDCVCIMDADLQDPPSLIPDMISILDENHYDCVATRRVSRKGEPAIRSFLSKNFYKFFNKFSDIDLVDGVRDFRMMRRPMVDAILELSEYNRFSKGIFSWVGFETKYLEYENIERAKGETNWSLFSLFKYSLEGILSFSTAFLNISTILGVVFSIMSFVFIIIIIVRTLLFGDSVSGWPSTISIILLIGGVQLLCIGMLGQYLAKMYMETKQRPIYN